MENRLSDHRLGAFARRHWLLMTLGGLGVLNFILYFPALGAAFMGDDFHWLGFLHFNYSAMLDGVGWTLWLTPFMTPGKWILFRPGLNLFYLLDYTAWQLDPIGYHLTDLALHVTNSFLVFLLGWQLTHQRVAGIAAGLLFALMPVHLQAVVWFSARADSLCAVWFLLSVNFFLLYRRFSQTRWLVYAVGGFAIGLTVKEIAATLPVMLLAYDVLYCWRKPFTLRQLIGAHFVFVSVLAFYVLLRWWLLDPETIRILSGASFLNSDWLALAQTYGAFLTDPLSDFSDAAGWLAFVLIAALLVAFRKRNVVAWSVVWLGVTILPSFVNLEHQLYDRFIYLPSVGLAILLAGILTQPNLITARWVRGVALGIFAVLAVMYGSTLYKRNEAWTRATSISQLVPEQVRALHSQFSPTARLVITGLPPFPETAGVQAFGYVAQRAMEIAYSNPSLQVISAPKFPLWLDRLDETFFFEYNLRRITERTDLIRALEQRRDCENVSISAVTWDFSKDAQSWEAWNDLSDPGVREGALVTRSLGNDPYMASPEIAIPVLAFGDVEIVMRVRADLPTMRGSVYWLASSQNDFFPGLQVSFPVQADDAWRTYRVNLAQSKQLLLGDMITRLRLDPVDAPAEIAIKSIRVYVHCDLSQGDRCVCAR